MKTSLRRRLKIGVLPCILSLLFFFFLILSLQNRSSSLIPLGAGLVFFLLGVGIYFSFAPRAGLQPLLFFHFLGGSALILWPTPPLNSFLSYLFFCLVVFIPPAFLHFTLLISETLIEFGKRHPIQWAPYLFSILLLPAYLYALKLESPLWGKLNLFFILSFVFLYLLWLARLYWIMKNPPFQLDGPMARDFLKGQILGVVIPYSVAAGIYFFGMSYPLSQASPLTLLFPISLWLSLIPGKRRQTEAYIVQSEKRQSFGNLLAGLAHELNNPLNFIYSNLEPFRDYLAHLKTAIPLSDSKSQKILGEMGQMVDDMEEGYTRSKNLIDKFRGFPGKKVEQKAEVDLNQIITRCIDLLAHKWKNKIALEKKLEPLPPFRAFPGEMEQVFTNLLANAFDATPEGGSVRVTTNKSPGGIKIVIRDTGQGIPKEEISKIYDPFFTTKEQGKGTGLGLSISLQIIKNHRGSIEVKSEVGKGTEFLILFPL